MIENMIIRHFYPVCQLYLPQSSKLDPQIYSNEYWRTAFINQDIFNISLLNYWILNIFYLGIALKCKRCINTGEPAAVFGFFLRITVVELILPESAAAGSLGVWVSKVSKVGWNDVAGCQGAWGNGGMDEWLHDCMEEKMKGRRGEGEKGRK